MKLNPNCSEGVMRINLKNLNPTEEAELFSHIGRLQEMAYDERNEDYEWWYDTGFENITVFEADFLEIRGETPYNYEDKLMEYLAKLPFFDLLQIE
jgi:hypothetical protein